MSTLERISLSLLELHNEHLNYSEIVEIKFIKPKQIRNLLEDIRGLPYMQSSEHIYELRETITLILWQKAGRAIDWEGCGISAAVSLRFKAPGKKFWLAELNQVFTLQLTASVVEGEPYSSQASFQILRTFGYCSLKWQVYLKHASHYNNNTHQFLRTSIFSGTGLDVPYVESLILITTSNKDSSLLL